MKQTLEIRTADGVAPAGLFRPDGRSVDAGVLFYMDALCPRPALDAMAQRLSDAGYVVLLPDLFYRFGDNYARFTGTSFTDETARGRIMDMVRTTTHAETESDA